MLVVLVLALLALAAPAQASVTLGADLSRPANAPFTCATLPAGTWLMPIGATSCTYYTTSAQMYPPKEVNIVPQDGGGYGVITKVRVKTGAVSGPMQVVTFRSMRQSQSTGDPGCCWPQYASPVFEPPADSVYELPTQLPVMNDTLLETYLPMPGTTLPIGPNTDPYGGLHEASTGLQGIQNYDQIALSILSPTATIPAEYDGSPEALGGMFWPNLSSTDMRILGLTATGNGSAVAGVHLLLQAVWEPDVDRDGLGDETQDQQIGAGTQTPPAGGGADAPVTVSDVKAPALTLKPAKTPLRDLRRRGLGVTVTCDEGCTLAARLLMARPLAHRLGLAAAAKPLAVGRGSASLSAAGKATLRIALTKRTRTALARVRSVRLTLEIVATDTKGNAAKRTRQLTFR